MDVVSTAIVPEVSGPHAIRRLRELLVWSFIAGGAVLIFVSLLPMGTATQAVIRGFGLALMPALSGASGFLRCGGTRRSGTPLGG